MTVGSLSRSASQKYCLPRVLPPRYHSKTPVSPRSGVRTRSIYNQSRHFPIYRWLIMGSCSFHGGFFKLFSFAWRNVLISRFFHLFCQRTQIETRGWTVIGFAIVRSLERYFPTTRCTSTAGRAQSVCQPLLQNCHFEFGEDSVIYASLEHRDDRTGCWMLLHRVGEVQDDFRHLWIHYNARNARKKGK